MVNKDIIESQYFEIENNIFYNNEFDCFINSKNRFSDNKWDFNELNKLDRDKSKYIVNFYNIDGEYIKFIKLFILHSIIFKVNMPRTCTIKIGYLRSFTKFLLKENVIRIELCTLEIVNKYFDYIENEMDLKKFIFVKKLIINFITYTSEVCEDNLKELIFNLSITKKMPKKYISSTSENDYIPDFFLNLIVSEAIKDIDNVKCELDDRLFSALLIILAETGIRCEDLIMLKSRSLSTVEIEGKKLHYLNFVVHKQRSKSSQIYLSDIAYKAYIICENLVLDYYKNLDKKKKERLLYYYLTGKTPSYSFTKLESNKITNLSIAEYEELERKATEYLWISSYNGKRIVSDSTFRRSLIKFFITHENRINNKVITEYKNHPEIDKLKVYDINNTKKYSNIVKGKYCKMISYNNIKGKKFYYINSHMFRVTVCTKLFEQNVHIDYIRKHMSHLSDDMALYYSKHMEKTNYTEESLNILKNITDDNGLVDVNSINSFNNMDIEIVNKINLFLKSNNFNIINDINKILKKLKNGKNIISENEFGICIKGLIKSECIKRARFSEIYDPSLLNIELNSYRYLDCDYERFLEKVKLYKYNINVLKCGENFDVEMEREKRSISRYVEKYLFQQVELLQKDIIKYGQTYIIENYENLVPITLDIYNIKKELRKWMTI